VLCGVLLGNNLIGLHVIEGLLTDLENELQHEEAPPQFSRENTGMKVVKVGE
jgi:hypothetical protein